MTDLSLFERALRRVFSYCRKLEAERKRRQFWNACPEVARLAQKRAADRRAHRNAEAVDRAQRLAVNRLLWPERWAR